MGLAEYKRKRDFHRTSEPAGKLARGRGHSYVIQKHHASHLHYDFRLELDGVLKSWAVPKGPSLDPTVKRLAMHVEDHPVEYGSFEGTIPKGEYGGGTVLLWDRGYWEPVGDPEEGYRSGRWKFRLHGEKLQGGWMLIRTGGEKKKDERRWLLFKEQDDEARPSKKGDVLERMPLSVSTGRDLEEIAARTDSVWSSKTGRKTKASSNGRPASTKKRPLPATVSRAKRGKLPTLIEVQLATLSDTAPEGDDWQHEIKFDGYRMICRIAKGKAQFISRNHLDWTKRLKPLAVAAEQLPVSQALLDGEVVAQRPDGTTHFQDLQNAFQNGTVGELQYYVFDLLHLDGKDLTPLPLTERREALSDLLSHSGTPRSLHLSDHIDGHGPDFFRQACQRGLEGIICKRKDQPYRSGRGPDWLKVKCVKHEEFVIGGFTEPRRSRKGVGAILVGYYNPDRDLIYSGKVGTGFDENALQSLREQLSEMEQSKSPFADLARAPAITHWVKPKLVAQIEFAAVTSDGILRHASFQGLREDKSPREVKRKAVVDSNGVVGHANGKSKSAVSGKGKSKSGRKSRDNKEVDYDRSKEKFAGVRLTSPEKVLYPDIGITKLELAEYYRSMADWILPHIADRPLVLVRCPEGLSCSCFYQKHPVQGTPDTLRRISIREKNKTEDYVIVDDTDGLVSLAQIGTLEIHAWGSRADRLEHPDRLIFDLDPDPTVPWKRVVESARQFRAFLKDLDLDCFVKTTGGKGLHLVVPIDRRHEWEEAKSFCKGVADAIVAADTTHYTANMSKAARPGKIFIDYLRNDRGATAVVPYSPRAKPQATVSVPLRWEELTARLRSDQYTIRSIAKRLSGLKKDPWDGIDAMRQSLTGPWKVLKSVTVS